MSDGLAGDGIAESPQFQLDVAAMLPRITQQVAEELRKRALDTFSYTATEIMKREITNYLQKEIVPTLVVELKAKEAEIRAGMITALVESMVLLNERVIDHARKRLTSYEGDSLIRQLPTTLFGQQEIA